MDISSILTDIAPVIIDGVGGALSNSVSNSLNKDVVSDYAAGTQDVANILKGGYDAQLGNYEQGSDVQEGLLRSGLVNVSDMLQNAARYYGIGMEEAVSLYEQGLLPAVDEYGNSLEGVEGQTGNLLKQGSKDFANTWQPYTDQGENALGYEANVMAQDPNQLNPGQKILFDKAKKDMLANLAASQLRGSGAGIAAINQGTGDLYAKLYDQNTQRSDAAARLLAQYGYGATGSVANNAADTAKTIADLRYKTGSNIASTQLAAKNDIANKRFKSINDVVSNQFNVNKGIADQMNKYYGNLTTIEGGRYGARGDVAYGKAAADAAAKQAAVNAGTSAATQNANSTGSLFGQLVNGVGGVIKDNMDKQYPKTNISPSNNNDYYNIGQDY